MRKIFGNATGIDISSEMVQLGQKYVSDIPNCNIVENNGTDLAEFSDNSFDFCYSFIVFQHIPEKQIVENYIKEVSRILKPRLSYSVFRLEEQFRQNLMKLLRGMECNSLLMKFIKSQKTIILK